MKKLYSLVATTLCAIAPLFSQAPAIQWQNTIGGDKDDRLTALQQTTDGGYILGGESNSNISGDKTENSSVVDYWVIKLDALGNIQWQNTIGGSSLDRLTSLSQTADGGYILGGTSGSNISGDKTENSLGDDYWVVKLDALGGIQWQNTIGGIGVDRLNSLQQTADGGYILGGESTSNISGDKTENRIGENDYWVVKLDATGAIQWQNTIGGSNTDELYYLQQATDGGYILGGRSFSDMSGDKTENSNGGADYWVLKLNATGDIQWQNTIGGSIGDIFYALQQTTDEGYILGGYSSSNISGDKTENNIGISDYWVVKLNSTGTIQWQNTIGGSSSDALSSLRHTTDGGYILGGDSFSNASGDKTENNVGSSDCWVLKLDATGLIQWQNTIGGSDIDWFSVLQQTADGGYILGGDSKSNISGDKTENSNGGYDFWVIKLAPDLVPTIEVSTGQKVVEIFPNPTANEVFVQSNEPATLCLRNAFGQALLTQTVFGNDKIDLSNLPNGVYFLVETETGFSHKILKNR